MGGIPAYRKIYTEIKRLIKQGTYKPGDLLPAEPELEKMSDVSRTTVRKAVSLLVADGYLKAKQGQGTEVLDVSTTQKLNKITSITETLEQKGYEITTHGMHISRVAAPEAVLEALDLHPGDTVYQVQRVQYANDAPIALMVNYLKENAVPDLDKYTNTFTGLYSFLEKQYHLILKDAVEWLSAVSADFTESQILRVPVGAPLLCSRRISNTELGPVEYSIIKLVADKYEYCVYLQGRGQ